MRRAVRGFATFVATVLIAGFLSAALVRYSPGFGANDCDWDPSISRETCLAMSSKAAPVSLPVFYVRYLRGAVSGNFGVSESLQQPVAELLRDRIAISSRTLLWGILGGLTLGGLLAWLAVWPRVPVLEGISVASSGLLLALPPAVVALFLFFRDWPLWLGIALALVPRVFGTARAVLEDFYGSPALLAARARGVGIVRLAGRYVVGPAGGQFVALAGVAVVLAFGFLIPVEALCDVPGVGQLVWLAAVKRDLPLLSGLALVVAGLVGGVQWLGETVE